MARIESSVFKTITDADWARQLPRARAVRNAVRDRIAAAVARRGEARILDVTSTQESRDKTS